MTKDRPCDYCEEINQCHIICSSLKLWIENKELKEKLRDDDIPLEILGLKIDIPTFH